MKGVPPDLDLLSLHGAEVTQVCLGQWQIQFHFHTGAIISVERNWLLTNEQGEVLDLNCDPPRERPFHLHLLLGHAVVGSEVAAPQSFTLRFTGGLILRISVDDSGYETFSIHPPGIVM